MLPKLLDFKLYFMKSSYTKIIENALFRLYKPLCIRIEKYRAYKLWKDGIRQCDELNEKLKVRVYLFWDSTHSCWAPLTYEPNKLHYPSIRELLRLGKMKGTNIPANVQQAADKCYYYTGSKNGAKNISENPALKLAKLKDWIAYYLLNVSVPMRKCRSYQLQQHR